MVAAAAGCMRRFSSARVRASFRARGGRGSLLLFLAGECRRVWVGVGKVRGGELVNRGVGGVVSDVGKVLSDIFFSF